MRTLGSTEQEQIWGQGTARESGEEDLGAAGLIGGAYLAGPVSPTCFT